MERDAQKKNRFRKTYSYKWEGSNNEIDNNQNRERECCLYAHEANKKGKSKKPRNVSVLIANEE